MARTATGPIIEGPTENSSTTFPKKGSIIIVVSVVVPAGKMVVVGVTDVDGFGVDDGFDDGVDDGFDDDDVGVDVDDDDDVDD